MSGLSLSLVFKNSTSGGSPPSSSAHKTFQPSVLRWCSDKQKCDTGSAAYFPRNSCCTLLCCCHFPLDTTGEIIALHVHKRLNPVLLQHARIHPRLPNFIPKSLKSRLQIIVYPASHRQLRTGPHLGAMPWHTFRKEPSSTNCTRGQTEAQQFALIFKGDVKAKSSC